MKQDIIQQLDRNFIDCGCYNGEDVDYPDIAHGLINRMSAIDRGILICGSGIGMTITANRHPHIRSALCFTVKQVSLARGHNDINVLSLSADETNLEDAIPIINAFMSVEFDGGRHQRRLNKI